MANTFSKLTITLRIAIIKDNCIILKGGTALRRSPLTPERIKALYNEYTANIDALTEIYENIHMHTDKSIWLMDCVKYSEQTRRIFEASLAASKEIGTIAEATEGLRPEQAEAFFNIYTIIINSDRYFDPFFFSKQEELLIKYYSDTGDIIRKIPLLSRLGREYIDRVHFGDPDVFPNVRKCFEEIISLRDKYDLIPERSVRKHFFMAYFFLASVLVTLNNPDYDINTAAMYLDEMKTFFYSDRVQKLDGNSQEIKNTYFNACYEFLWLDKFIFEASSKTKELYVNLADELYLKSLATTGGSMTRLAPNVVLAYRHAQVIKGDCDMCEATQFVMDYYLARRNDSDTAAASERIFSEHFYFEARLPLILITGWLTDSSIPPAMRDQYTHILFDNARYYLIEMRKRNPAQRLLRSFMAEWAFDIIGYMNDTDEQEQLIQDMILNNNLPTFFHTHMVDILSSLFAESVFRNAPSLFYNLIGTEDESEVLKNREDVILFIHKCALFHDIGKNRISRIITTQHRQLYPEEFKAIRRHPELGASRLYDGLSRYRDVILGHHKTFDMAGGYPPDYEGDGSRYKIICDIFAICDALDAATDSLWRSYAPKKNFATVTVELMKGAGTKYNPDIVRLLQSDESLYRTINELLSNRRDDLYYDWFTRYYK